jgi:hypothetical protein
VCVCVCRKWHIDMKDKLPLRAGWAAIIPSSEHGALWFLLKCIDVWIMFIGPVVYGALEKLDSFVSFSYGGCTASYICVLIYIRCRAELILRNSKWSVSFQWLPLGTCCGLLVRYTQRYPLSCLFSIPFPYFLFQFSDIFCSCLFVYVLLFSCT